jgi:trehalose/maltose hydrolase-like predicted phosphorylase
MLHFPLQRPYEYPPAPTYANGNGWSIEDPNPNACCGGQGSSSAASRLSANRDSSIFAVSNGRIGISLKNDYSHSDVCRLFLQLYGMVIKRDGGGGGKGRLATSDEELVSSLIVDISVAVDGHSLMLGTTNPRNRLDLRTGQSSTTLTFRSAEELGYTAQVTIDRLTSIVEPSLCGFNISGTILSAPTRTPNSESPPASLSIVARISSYSEVFTAARESINATEGSISLAFQKVGQHSLPNAPSDQPRADMIIQAAAPAQLRIHTPKSRHSDSNATTAAHPCTIGTTRHVREYSGAFSDRSSNREGWSGDDSQGVARLDLSREGDDSDFGASGGVDTSRRQRDADSFELLMTLSAVDKLSFLISAAVEAPGGAPAQLPAAASSFDSYPSLLQAQSEELERRWAEVDVTAQLQDEVYPLRLQTSLRYSLFCVLCNAAGCGPGVGITKTGLSAEDPPSGGDNGQVCFQFQLFHSIFLTFSAPDLAKKQLEFLISKLPAARSLARKLSIPSGALYPMQAVHEPECGSYFLDSTARLHINGDVAYLTSLFLECHPSLCREESFLFALFEMVLETALLWLHLGHWEHGRQVFQIDAVTGPDAYNAMVEGDFYSNGIAKHHMLLVPKMAGKLLKLNPEQYRTLLNSCGVSQSTIEELARAGAAIVLHRDDSNGVFYSHKHFQSLPRWDAEKKPLAFPLSRFFHPLAIYRHNFCQMPSVLLGMLILPNFDRRLNNFETLDFRRNLKYYEPITTHDIPESLSIMSATQFRSYGDFGRGTSGLEAVSSLDLDNTLMQAPDDPLRLSAMASTWFVLAFGIGALKVEDGTVSLSPALPVGWAKAEFRISFQGATILVSILPRVVRYELIKGESFRLIHFSSRIHLYKAAPQLVQVPSRQSSLVGTSPPVDPQAAALEQMLSPRANPSVVEIPRFVQQQVTAHFDGIIFLLDAIVEGFSAMQYEVWREVLDRYFTSLDDGVAREPLTLEEWVGLFCCARPEGEAAGESPARSPDAPSSANFRQYSGLETVLQRRCLSVPLGSITDAVIVRTRYGIANAKVALLAERLEQAQLRFIAGVSDMLWDLRRLGLRVAVVSNTRTLNETISKIDVLPTLFTTTIDGNEARDKRMRGRPYMDIFEKAAVKMHLSPDRCVVFADHINSDFFTADLKKFRAVVNIVDPDIPLVRPRAKSTGSKPTRSAIDGDSPSAREMEPTIRDISTAQFPPSVNILEDLILRPGSS